jgi:hypothetical protein
MTTANTGGGSTTTNLYQGSAFTAEVLGAARYSILPFLSLSLEAGYRLANVSKMQDTAGKSLKKNATDDMAIDFSGANLGGGLVFSF